MMVVTYSIFDAGSLVASFDREDVAYDALERLAAPSPEARDGLIVVASTTPVTSSPIALPVSASRPAA
jgi:hypothetical protein